MTLGEFQAYGYFGLTVFLAVMLWWYIFYLYRSEVKGEKDFEKYGKIALDDEITDECIEKKEEGSEESSKKDGGINE